ncbi:MAG: gliding motility-associated C-terminal domain-containing protein, partial [Bacteroidota bacterium]
LLIPNVFSPGDAEYENQAFRLYGLKADIIKEVKFIVYDRWGTMVFEASSVEDAEIGWDGTTNGKPLPAGVFVYYVRIILLGDEEIIEKGDVTLLR